MTFARRWSRWRTPSWLGPAMFLLVSAAGILAVFWGYFNPPNLVVEIFDAGPVDRFAVHRVVVYPERDLYIVGMEDGRLRAIDGRINGTDCRVEWLPEDTRGAVRNPAGLPGVFHDSCSGALWSFEGNAISGSDQPLRTPHIAPKAGPVGSPERVTVELINSSR